MDDEDRLALFLDYENLAIGAQLAHVEAHGSRRSESSGSRPDLGLGLEQVTGIEAAVSA